MIFLMLNVGRWQPTLEHSLEGRELLLCIIFQVSLLKVAEVVLGARERESRG